MPVHDFKCLSCGRIHEGQFFSNKDLKRGEQPEIECPDCHGSCVVNYEEVNGNLTTYRFDNPGIYGKPYPCFGNQIVRDAAHYRELCKKYNVQPAGDRVGGMNPMEHEMQETHTRNENERRLREQLAQQENAGWHPSQEEIQEHFRSEIDH